MKSKKSKNHDKLQKPGRTDAIKKGTKKDTIPGKKDELEDIQRKNKRIVKQTGTGQAARANTYSDLRTESSALQFSRVSEFVQKPDPSWSRLKDFTAARIALGRTGSSQTTASLLSFQLDHSRARDAIYSTLDVQRLQNGLSRTGCSTLLLRSRAEHRSQYLRRPDLGRQLDKASIELIKKEAAKAKASGTQEFQYDLLFVIVDGLSARAVHDHSIGFIESFQELTKSHKDEFRTGPVCIVEQGRVAIGDPIGEALNASLVAVLIGERPGLSSPDSMGLYMTYSPRIGTTDERRNCISNIRPEGLPLLEAARRFQYLARQALQRQLSGVFLKDKSVASLEGHESTEQ